MRGTGRLRSGCRYWGNLLLAGLAALLIGLLIVVYGVFPVLNARGVAHPGRAPVCCTTPADHGLHYEDVSFLTAGGIALRGWYIPSRNRAAVILTHGIAGNRLAMLDLGLVLARHGYGVLLFDERAHGESEGDTVTFGGDDVLAALDFVQSRDDVDPTRIGALGLSLGGLVAIEAAARHEGLRAVVADGPGPGVLGDMAPRSRLVDWLWLPFDWVWFQVLAREGVTAPVPLVEALPDLAPRPLLLIGGTAADYERAAIRRYYALAGEPKTLWEIPEAGHTGGWRARPAEYEARIVAFFDQALLLGQEAP